MELVLFLLVLGLICFPHVVIGLLLIGMLFIIELISKIKELLYKLFN